MSAHGVNGDKGAGKLQPLQQPRNGGNLVGFGVRCLLPQHETLARRPSGDQMQRPAPSRPVMAAARGLAVNGDDVGGRFPQAFHPGGKAFLEQIRVQRLDHVVQGVVSRSAPRIGEKPTQKLQPQIPPIGGFLRNPPCRSTWRTGPKGGFSATDTAHAIVGAGPSTPKNAPGSNRAALNTSAFNHTGIFVAS